MVKTKSVRTEKGKKKKNDGPWITATALSTRWGYSRSGVIEAALQDATALVAAVTA